MSVAKSIEISIESTGSYEECLQEGITAAAKTVKNIKSAWVKNHIVVVEKNKIKKHRIHLMVTFELNDRA